MDILPPFPKIGSFP